MKKRIYKGNDAPVILSITHLKGGVLIIICLDAKEKCVEISDDFPEGKEYEYITIEGLIPVLSARAILEGICLLGCFDKVDMNLIQALEEKCPDEDMLEIIQDVKVQDITFYDSSSDVNSFYYQEAQFWLDKDTRVGLVNSTNMLKSIGRETTTLWLNDVSVTLQCDTVLQMLCAIEIYALECYNVTASHKAQVMQLTTIQDILEYDIKNGYPGNLIF